MVTSRSFLTATALLLSLGAAPETAWARRWMDTSGRFSIDAEFVKLEAETVHLRKSDGSEVKVPLQRLCEDDRRLLRELNTEHDRRLRREPDTEQVLVEGVGRNLEEALQDAFRRAVQSVVGTLVDTTTQVQNDKLILDEVLTYSGGFVPAWRPDGEPVWKDGIVRRPIVATVRKGAVLERISAGNAPLDGQDLYSEAYTKICRLKSGLLMMRKELAKFPAEVLRWERSSRLEGVKPGANCGKVVHEVVLTIDERKYDQARNRLIAILESMSKIQGCIRTSYVPAPDMHQKRFRNRFLVVPPSPPVTAEFGPIEQVKQNDVDGISKEAMKTYRPEDSSTRLTINVDPGTAGGTARWRFFEFEGIPDLPSSTALVFTMAYRNAQDQPIYKEEVTVGPERPGISVDSHKWSDGRLNTIVMGPFFVWHEQLGSLNLVTRGSRSLTLRGEATLTLKQMYQMKPFDVRVSTIPLKTLLDLASQHPESSGETFRPSGAAATPPGHPQQGSGSGAGGTPSRAAPPVSSTGRSAYAVPQSAHPPRPYHARTEGRVRDVRGGRITVDLGRRDGLTSKTHLVIKLGHNNKEIDAFPVRVDEESCDVQVHLTTLGLPRPLDLVRVTKN